MWVNVQVCEPRAFRREAPAPARSQLRLYVLEATKLKQLRDLLVLRLAHRASEESACASSPYSPPARPSTAPAAAAGHVAESLAAAGSSVSPTSRSKRLAVHLIFEGRRMQGDDEERCLQDLGVRDGAVVHCLASVEVDAAQQISCHPHSCHVDGGRLVHVLGEHFPFSNRAACRFGRSVVDAEVKDDGAEAGISELTCIAPAHPAGPVTLGVSFDGGVSWLDGPTFWYLDPALSGGGHGICVRADYSAGAQRVRGDVSVRPLWDSNWGQDDYDPGGAGCA
eukprot:TRINITY_DN95277_c0_g1_i1.p1 TRINITY_DN95277_c0_g1~~TRINITY_DN95277_c0_g1_i1.p1  ORF type:complete len:281 (-),score=44.44 TRINITY_DN95277_c0_g1_i1:85-927(-)